MRLVSLFALGAFALALSTVGCSADVPEETTASENDLTIAAEEVATDSDKGKTIRVYEGQDFVLKLGANATTGYSWKVTKTNRSFAYPYASTYEMAHSASPAGVPSMPPPMGAGGTAVFKWSTNPVTDVTGTPLMSKVGKHEIALEYRRPWEPLTSAPAKTFKLTVEIIKMPDVPTPPKNDGQCGDDVCGDGQSCQLCWGQMACIPNGALC